ncbi:MAG: DUF2892 domain-containing protein [Bacteroidia bacterium]|nr:DUF2892 domain-containing protein [Bacteroidia bacterium]
MKLQPNVGGKDKIIRYIAGGVLVGAGIYYTSWIAIIIGSILALTAAVGRCGLYYILGINTCIVKKGK